jgi:hypothetical protein
MTMDQRLTDAARTVADGVVVPEVNLEAVRSAARTNRRRRVAIAVTVVVAAIVVAGTAIISGRDVSAPQPAPPVPSEKVEAINTRGWDTYTSDLYDLDVGHPPDWLETPASRKWRLEEDGGDRLSPAHEAFRSPQGDVRVSVWTAPLDPKTRQETTEFLQTWVEDYCEATGNAPCTGIADRAVELCLEKRDCHPGLLVPFKDDVQAFFSGGMYDADAMTVVAVWCSESDSSVVTYGGAQRLLEGFLSTMKVWPASTPVWDRR